MYSAFCLVAPYSSAFLGPILRFFCVNWDNPIAIIQLISQSIYKLNYSALVVFMGFHENLLGFARPQNELYYLPDLLFWFDWFDDDFEKRFPLNSQRFFQDSSSKNLEDDVFIRTLRLMACHQVLMEPGSKLITIFDPSDGVFMTNLLCCVCSETKSLCLFHFSLSYVNHLHSSHTLSVPCSKTQEGKKIIIYYGPLSTLTWSSIFFHHCALPVHGQLEKWKIISRESRNKKYIIIIIIKYNTERCFEMS